jgi:predicted enzyme related to lactoylglutathione lyase
MSASNNKLPAGIVWYEIATDDVGRAETSYPRLFGWKMKRFPGNSEYRHLNASSLDALPGAGTMEPMPSPFGGEKKIQNNCPERSACFVVEMENE